MSAATDGTHNIFNEIQGNAHCTLDYLNVQQNSAFCCYQIIGWSSTEQFAQLMATRETRQHSSHNWSSFLLICPFVLITLRFPAKCSLVWFGVNWKFAEVDWQSIEHWYFWHWIFLESSIRTVSALSHFKVLKIHICCAFSRGIHQTCDSRIKMTASLCVCCALKMNQRNFPEQNSQNKVKSNDIYIPNANHTHNVHISALDARAAQRI